MLNIDATPRLTSPRGGRCKGCGSNSRLQGAAGYRSLSFPQGRIILFSSGLCSSQQQQRLHRIFFIVRAPPYLQTATHSARLSGTVAACCVACRGFSDVHPVRVVRHCLSPVCQQSSCWKGLNSAVRSLTWGQLSISSVQTCAVRFKQSASPTFLSFGATPGVFLPAQSGVTTQFDLIQLNSSALCFASGLLSLCRSNKCSAVEFGSL